MAEALADADKAVTIQPGMAQGYTVRARLRKASGNLKGALDDCDKAIEAEPDDAWSYFTRASIQEESRDWKEALEDYQASMKKDASISDNAQMRLFLVRGRQGKGEAAKASLSEYLKTRPPRQGTEWELKILACLTGDLKPSELVGLAPEASVGRRCEAYYYAGMLQILRGDKSEGADLLKKCVEVGQKSFYEHWHAVAELETLKAGK
jgi:tetratricopeptide (TPR) repeat protein